MHSFGFRHTFVLLNILDSAFLNPLTSGCIRNFIQCWVFSNTFVPSQRLSPGTILLLQVYLFFQNRTDKNRDIFVKCLKIKIGSFELRFRSLIQLTQLQRQWQKKNNQGKDFCRYKLYGKTMKKIQRMQMIAVNIHKTFSWTNLVWRRWINEKRLVVDSGDRKIFVSHCNSKMTNSHLFGSQNHNFQKSLNLSRIRVESLLTLIDDSSS